MLALRLPPEIEKRLHAIAALTGRPMSYYAREAITEHLTDLEEIYMAEQRLEDIKAGKAQTVPLDEFEKQFESDCIRAESTYHS